MNDNTQSTPDRDEWRDRVIDRGLREVVGGETPPDLSQRIAAAESVAPVALADHEQDVAGASPVRHHSSAADYKVGLAIAASLLVAGWLIFPSVRARLQVAKTVETPADSASSELTALASSTDESLVELDEAINNVNELAETTVLADDVSGPQPTDELSLMVTPQLVANEAEDYGASNDAVVAGMINDAGVLADGPQSLTERQDRSASELKERSLDVAASTVQPEDRVELLQPAADRQQPGQAVQNFPIPPGNGSTDENALGAQPAAEPAGRAVNRGTWGYYNNNWRAFPGEEVAQNGGDGGLGGGAVANGFGDQGRQTRNQYLYDAPPASAEQPVLLRGETTNGVNTFYDVERTIREATEHYAITTDPQSGGRQSGVAPDPTRLYFSESAELNKSEAAPGLMSSQVEGVRTDAPADQPARAVELADQVTTDESEMSFGIGFSRGAEPTATDAEPRAQRFRADAAPVAETQVDRLAAIVPYGSEADGDGANAEFESFAELYKQSVQQPGEFAPNVYPYYATRGVPAVAERYAQDWVALGLNAKAGTELLASANVEEQRELMQIEVKARVALEQEPEQVARVRVERRKRLDDLMQRIQTRIEAEAQQGVGPGESGDKYERIVDNPFKRTAEENLSTFSIDVDTASYANVRQFLTQSGQLPPPDAVRVEELINYFTYSYSGPTDDTPFSANLELAACPWESKHKLVRIGIKGRELLTGSRPQSNLVFLIDVSGSMNKPAKLPLLVEGMKMLTRELTENDRVAIVVYASSEGLALPCTPGTEQETILAALDRLRAGGSTAGGAGIQLAYDIAEQNFVEGGVNRVILCTDGDFNVGVTSPAELERMAEEKAKSTKVALTVLGFGRGNLNDQMMEKISGKGNGNYYYIDTRSEAEKVLVAEMAGTLVTIAKDVKIQVDFNPAKVAGYRLIGYANRMLEKEDFNDDTKDAGEIGAGHTVTALYEIVPAGEQVAAADVDESKYVRAAGVTAEAVESDELLTVRMRYKQPDGDVSTKVEFPLTDSDQEFAAASDDYRFATAVASFGMLLRNSEFAGDSSMAGVEEIAANSIGDHDEKGYRAEFVELVQRARELRGE